MNKDKEHQIYFCEWCSGSYLGNWFSSSTHASFLTLKKKDSFYGSHKMGSVLYLSIRGSCSSAQFIMENLKNTQQTSDSQTCKNLSTQCAHFLCVCVKICQISVHCEWYANHSQIVQRLFAVPLTHTHIWFACVYWLLHVWHSLVFLLFSHLCNNK